MACMWPVSAERPAQVSQSFQIRSNDILGEFTSLGFTLSSTLLISFFQLLQIQNV